MKNFSGLILLTLSISGVFAANTTTQFPLCTICKCKTNKHAEKDYADVICTSIVSHDIYKLDFWETKDEKNKTHLYNYHSFTIQNNVFTNLSKEFPLSNLVYLNLANNRIVKINQNVFKNLESMEVLILSHNDLDDIDPDGFKVS